MLHHPANDVREGLRRVLDPVDELDLVVLDTPVGGADRKLLREVVVQPDVIAEERVRTERDVVDADQAAQYSKCSMKLSIECLGCFFVSVVCGAASIPMTPPFAAIAFKTSSGFMRFVFQSPRAPAWVMKIGFSLTSIVSSDV